MHRHVSIAPSFTFISQQKNLHKEIFLFFVYLFFPVLRRETINTFEYFFGPRVFLPPVTLPHIVFGLLVPLPCLPSPPPYGWSTGFIAVPRTVGRIPFQRLLPALP